MAFDPNTDGGDGFVHLLFGIIDVLGGALVAVMGWFLNSYSKKIDALEKRKHLTEADLEGKFVKPADLDDKFDRLREDFLEYNKQNQSNVMQRHEENIENNRLLRKALEDNNNQVREDVRSLHRRIDDALKGN